MTSSGPSAGSGEVLRRFLFPLECAEACQDGWLREWDCGIPSTARMAASTFWN